MSALQNRADPAAARMTRHLSLPAAAGLHLLKKNIRSPTEKSKMLHFL
jgi:hypothetical protein